ncbi:hypothetical protein EDF58_103302 [Novosphingobium sp. PhB57]|uniref:PepSY-associated TM helix domain-containing protein n=1 Tax=Novosphingobium sp. PhB57 TaxID=2485107 RepID=UPI001052579D|nr:PepSY-associated TM helix domain-containing protein [Novosphingobium sp. PhB57]TCU58766.1 hypothetical protein EDF58_103302 [Novosphingobium sp. PhB57]
MRETSELGGQGETLEVLDKVDPESSDGLGRASSPASHASSGRSTKPARQSASSKKKNKKARAFWLKQLHTWHWVSAAVSLAGMFLFAITGITLNHAASIGAEPQVVQSQGKIAPSLLRRLPPPGDGNLALPPEVAKAVAAAVPLDPSGFAADWSAEDEVYVAMPGPGRDAWVSIDRSNGAVSAEVTRRGAISYLNDLHKGRNTGSVWFWFIDLFAAACVIFTVTGLFLLQLHARHRPSTWPLVGLSLLIPLAIALIFIH